MEILTKENKKNEKEIMDKIKESMELEQKLVQQVAGKRIGTLNFESISRPFNEREAVFQTGDKFVIPEDFHQYIGATMIGKNNINYLCVFIQNRDFQKMRLFPSQFTKFGVTPEGDSIQNSNNFMDLIYACANMDEVFQKLAKKCSEGAYLEVTSADKKTVRAYGYSAENPKLTNTWFFNFELVEE